MRIVALAVLALLFFWSQPWSSATATPRVWRSEGAGLEASGKCKSGWRKSTVTAKCVRAGSRFPMLGW